MQKKILSIILCMILCILPLSGCKKNVGTPEDNAVSPEEEKQEETEVYTFGYTCTTMADNPYFAVLEEAIREEVEKQGGQMITRDPKGDDTLQLEQINEMIEEGIDAIFLSPVNWETIQPGLDALREAGVKIINIDTEVKDLNLVDAYVGTDNKQAGYLCGEDVVQRFPEGGKVLILECPNTNSINERITGFEEAIADQGFEIVARENVNGSKEISMETTKRLLKQYPDVDVIMCGNDQTALGAKSGSRDRSGLCRGCDLRSRRFSGFEKGIAKIRRYHCRNSSSAADYPWERCSKISIPGAGWGKDKRADL